MGLYAHNESWYLEKKLFNYHSQRWCEMKKKSNENLNFTGTMKKYSRWTRSWMIKFKNPQVSFTWGLVGTDRKCFISGERRRFQLCWMHACQTVRINIWWHRYLTFFSSGNRKTEEEQLKRDLSADSGYRTIRRSKVSQNAPKVRAPVTLWRVIKW